MSFMSTLTIKALDLTRSDRCDCEDIAHAAGFWIQRHGCGQLPFPRDARLDGCCSRFSVAASDPLCSRWHLTGFGLWVLKTQLETAVKARTLVSDTAFKRKRENMLHDCVYVLVGL